MIEGIKIRSLRDDPAYVQCPRCRNYHRMQRNHDGLCDRCCRVLLDLGHAASVQIRAAFQAQRDFYRHQETPL